MLLQSTNTSSRIKLTLISYLIDIFKTAVYESNKHKSCETRIVVTFQTSLEIWAEHCANLSHTL